MAVASGIDPSRSSRSKVGSNTSFIMGDDKLMVATTDSIDSQCIPWCGEGKDGFLLFVGLLRGTLAIFDNSLHFYLENQ